MLRIDTHQHVIPPDYRKALQKAGVDDSGGRAVPDWTVDTALQTMAELDIASAILSVSTPAAGHYFAAGLDRLDDDDRAAIDRTNALALFPRFGTPATAVPVSGRDRIRGTIRRQALRVMVKAVGARG